MFLIEEVIPLSKSYEIYLRKKIFLTLTILIGTVKKTLTIHLSV
jgi:hypothetical protein